MPPSPQSSTGPEGHFRSVTKQRYGHIKLSAAAIAVSGAIERIFPLPNFKINFRSERATTTCLARK